MSLAPGDRLGVYEIVGLIGAGGMGEVYRARDARLNRDVAIKVLPVSFATDAERLERFEQEARAAAALNHPNILSVFDVGAKDGAPYVVSELLEGETLRERLSSGAMSVRKAVEYAVQLAHGLAAAHEKGIVHRDLKPENIFLTADERLKILDFGLAKLVETPDVLSGASNVPTTPRIVTQPGVMLGTMGYAAPEQLRGLHADHRADIFSFGVILYELLAGRRAFAGQTVIDTMTAIIKDNPPDLPVADVTFHRRSSVSSIAASKKTPRRDFNRHGISVSRSRDCRPRANRAARAAACAEAPIGVVQFTRRVDGCRCVRSRMRRRDRVGSARTILQLASLEAPELRLQVHVPEVEAPSGGLNAVCVFT